MAGTIEGGRKAAKTNKENYGPDFYKRVGAIGGRNGRTGGFAANPELAKTAGAIGGSRSKRGFKYDRETGEYTKRSGSVEL